ncbi:hypothetical protein TNCV_40181 [Trichonephila clavipes]|nr:hypothetical protein TNCV_40181 [Trichonephila clavipes]
MSKIQRTPAELNFPIVLSEDFIAEDDDNVYADPIMVDKNILHFVQSSKNILHTNSDDENELNNAAALSVPTSFDMRNNIKYYAVI